MSVPVLVPSWPPVDPVWPVVVVGAGPAGLVAANSLARNGVRCLLVAKSAPSTHPKATVASLRTMELFRSWALVEAIRAGGNDVEWRMLVADTLADAGTGRAIDVGYPSIARSAELSPTRPWAVPQDHLESVLLGAVRELPPARVELDEVVQDVRPGRHAVQLVVRNIGTGRLRTIAARYVIAADGAYSAVRSALGITAPTRSAPERTGTAVVHAPLWTVLGDRRFGLYLTESPLPGIFLPAGREDRWLVGFEDPPRGPVLDPQRLAGLIRSAAGRPDLPVQVGAVKPFTFVAALADRFAAGRVYLVGDAAHRVTPRGGTGMNMAIAGAANLAWKLSWVLRGWADESLLDTYEAERRPPAEHNVARSLDPLGSRRGADAEVPVDLAGRIPHRWVDGPAGRHSTLDLVGPGLTRLVSMDDRPAGRRRGGGPPVSVRRLDPVTAALIGADRPGGLLVRPDGVPLDDRVHRSLAARRAAVA